MAMGLHRFTRGGRRRGPLGHGGRYHPDLARIEGEVAHGVHARHLGLHRRVHVELGPGQAEVPVLEPGEVGDLADAHQHEVRRKLDRGLVGPPHDDALEPLPALDWFV